jgi:short-subunit dehydrogenase
MSVDEIEVQPQQRLTAQDVIEGVRFAAGLAIGSRLTRPRGLPEPAVDRTCLITGASSGIGAALAHELASRGYGVTLVARRANRLTTLAVELSQTYGVRAECVPCDLTDAAARREMFDQVRASGRMVDILVNNAGVATSGRFLQADPAHEIEQVRVLCEALVDVCAAFTPPMSWRRNGAVLIVSSAGGLQPTPNVATYSAAKAFALSLGESLHAELRSSGIPVTTVCPGPVSNTGIFDFGQTHPTQRVFPRALWLTPEQVARASIHALARNKRVLVPGHAARAVATACRIGPRAAQLRLLNRFYRGS